ncbi:MAG TPA: SURF1 family protein [Steroidobacteraceae bacterium]|nr:SURF1 family protein [Steroidobacteraceae bacterium]
MKWGFAPSWSVTLGALALCALFIRLGIWQWERGNTRAAEWTKFSQGADKVELLGARGLSQVARFQRVSLDGRYEPDHQFLLDNRTYDGRAGYEVLTPLDRPDGRIALVDRGWVPFAGSRNKLPAVTLEIRTLVTVIGRADDLPSGGLAAGRAAPSTDSNWPKVTSYPTMSELSAALGRPLEPRIVLLDPQAPDGYVRAWHPPGMQPLRHWSYAIQWWCFAAVTVIFWVILSRRKTSP